MKRPLLPPAQAQQLGLALKAATYVPVNPADCDIEHALELIRMGASLDEKGDSDSTPLMQAALYDLPDVAVVLIRVGARLDTCNNFGRTPLMAAARHKHRRILTALIEKGAPLDQQDSQGETAVINATSSNGQAGSLAQLLAAGADPNLATSRGTTALMIAAKENKRDHVKALLAHNALTTLVDRDGKTARDHAVEKGQSAIPALIDAHENKLADRAAARQAMRISSAHAVTPVKFKLR